MKPILTFLAVLLLTTPLIAQPVTNPKNGHQYLLVAIPPNTTWHTTRDSATALGGYLATITSQEEWDFVLAYTSQTPNNACFLGGTDEASEGNWQWVTGEPFTFSMWRPCEPNNAWTDEDYIAFAPHELMGQWNDIRNWLTIPGYFLVEWGESDSLPNDDDTVKNQALYVRGPSYTLAFDALLVELDLNVTLSDIIPPPNELGKYDVVLVNSYGACNPTTASYLQSYMSTGGGVVLISGTPLFFGLPGIQTWFGASSYVNSYASLADYTGNPAPFDPGLASNALLTDHSWGSGAGDAGVSGVTNPEHILGVWRDGPVFAFWNEYGLGRLFYSASMLGDDPRLREDGNRALWIAAIKWTAGMRECDSIPSTIAGTVRVASLGVEGVEFDLFDASGGLVNTVKTDQDGQFQFEPIDEGEYVISAIPPLGFACENSSVSVVISSSCQPIIVDADFDLVKLAIIPTQRTRNYWAHQAYKAFIGAPLDYRVTDFARFTGLIKKHFNDNTINPVDFYTVPQPADQMDSLDVLRGLLLMESNGGIEHFQARYAKSELMTMMLNVASGRISQTHVISADGRTVSQAITYCDYLVNGAPSDMMAIYESASDSLWKYRRAISIASQVNSGVQVGSGKIPESIEDIWYKHKQQAALPTEFGLSQNYPNPFNPSTEISYRLPTATHVSLEVYNLTGQRVATLVKTDQSAGIHTVRWDASQYASGVYMYRLTAGEFVETKKMLLIK